MGGLLPVLVVSVESCYLARFLAPCGRALTRAADPRRSSGARPLRSSAPSGRCPFPHERRTDGEGGDPPSAVVIERVTAGCAVSLSSTPHRFRPRTMRRSSSAPPCVAQKKRSSRRSSRMEATCCSAKPSHEAPTRPETSKGRSIRREPELRNVPLEKRPDEVLAPLPALLIRRSDERSGEPSLDPEIAPRACTGFVQA